ncbi:MAG: hypothetical protein HZB66_00045 [Candidatus Aenigmarchaeota archaeon]|nr:hypothetical protein [Candidatus Aenigmarchaeota archaeon]
MKSEKRPKRRILVLGLTLGIALFSGYFSRPYLKNIERGRTAKKESAAIEEGFQKYLEEGQAREKKMTSSPD